MRKVFTAFILLLLATMYISDTNAQFECPGCGNPIIPSPRPSYNERLVLNFPERPPLPIGPLPPPDYNPPPAHNPPPMVPFSPDLVPSGFVGPLPPVGTLVPSIPIP